MFSEYHRIMSVVVKPDVVSAAWQTRFEWKNFKRIPVIIGYDVIDY